MNRSFEKATFNRVYKFSKFYANQIQSLDGLLIQREFLSGLYFEKISSLWPNLILDT